MRNSNLLKNIFTTQRYIQHDRRNNSVHYFKYVSKSILFMRYVELVLKINRGAFFIIIRRVVMSLDFQVESLVSQYVLSHFDRKGIYIESNFVEILEARISKTCDNVFCTYL